MARRLHNWGPWRSGSWDKDLCRNCGAFRWAVLRSTRPGQATYAVTFLYGRDGINWSTGRPECRPTSLR